MNHTGKKFKLWTEYGALNSKPVFDAFRTSVVDSGHSICNSTDLNDANVHVIWSVLFHGRMSRNRDVWNYCQRTGKPIIVLEVGGIKRGETWKIGLNGIGPTSYYDNKRNDRERTQTLGLSLKPWRTDGEFVLICGQHDKSLQWQNQKPLSQWFMNTIEKIQSHSKRPIIIRPHPRCRVDSIERQYKNVYRQDPVHIQGTYDNFDLAFERIWATISVNSNPGPQSIIAGVPAFVETSSLAYPVANDIDFLHDIETPLMPDRDQWLTDYAWTEFTLEEISKGLPLERLTTNLF